MIRPICMSETNFPLNFYAKAKVRNEGPQIPAFNFITLIKWRFSFAFSRVMKITTFKNYLYFQKSKTLTFVNKAFSKCWNQIHVRSWCCTIQHCLWGHWKLTRKKKIHECLSSCLNIRAWNIKLEILMSLLYNSTGHYSLWKFRYP